MGVALTDPDGLHPEDLEAFRLAGLEIMVSGIDEILADMSKEMVLFGVQEMFARQGQTPEARMRAAAWLDVWQQVHGRR